MLSFSDPGGLMLEKLMDIVRLICAIFLPPLGVFLQVGIGTDFWIKRCFDVVFAGILIVLLAPIYLLMYYDII